MEILCIFDLFKNNLAHFSPKFLPKEETAKKKFGRKNGQNLRNFYGHWVLKFLIK